MKQDQLGLLISQTSDYPGSHGDSCAETCRLYVLRSAARDPRMDELMIELFRTSKGYLRHPAIANWWGGEDDFSSDQALPMLMALDCMGNTQTAKSHTLLAIARERLKWKTGRHFASLGVMALARKMWNTFAALQILQALVFKIPIRWSDSKNWFESTHGSSADYLNFAVALIYLEDCGVRWHRRIVLWLCPANRIFERVTHYYASEPPSGIRTEILTGYYNRLRHLTY